MLSYYWGRVSTIDIFSVLSDVKTCPCPHTLSYVVGHSLGSSKLSTKEESKKEEKMAEAESKHDKFKRLASQRVTNAIKKIELIGNLTGSGYESTPEEVEKIFVALQQTLDSTKDKFSKTKRVDSSKFEL